MYHCSLSVAARADSRRQADVLESQRAASAFYRTSRYLAGLLTREPAFFCTNDDFSHLRRSTETEQPLNKVKPEENRKTHFPLYYWPIDAVCPVRAADCKSAGSLDVA